MHKIPIFQTDCNAITGRKSLIFHKPFTNKILKNKGRYKKKNTLTKIYYQPSPPFQKGSFKQNPGGSASSVISVVVSAYPQMPVLFYKSPDHLPQNRIASVTVNALSVDDFNFFQTTPEAVIDKGFEF